MRKHIKIVCLHKEIWGTLFKLRACGGMNPTRHWAVIATLIENCKLCGINPHTWLTDILTKLANGHHTNRVDELMPWTAVV